MKKFYLIILIAISLIPVNSKAADTYTLLEPLPCIAGVSNICTDGNMQKEIDVTTYVLYIYKFAIAISVFLAIVMIIWGGFLITLSETPFKIEDGKEKIWNAVIGLGMVLASYLILVTIDPRLVDVQVNIPPVRYNKDAMDASNDRLRAGLEESLESLSAESQQKIIDNNAKLNDLKAQKTAINDQKVSGKMSIEEANLQMTKIDDQISKTTVDSNVLLANHNGITAFKDAISIINNPDDTSNSRSENLKVYTANQLSNDGCKTGNCPTNSENTIQNEYNTRINKIMEACPNSCFTQIEQLSNQRDFYIAQVREGSSLHSTLSGPAIEQKIKLAKYKVELADQAKQKASGLPLDQYTQIYKTRINTLNDKLGNPKP